MTAIARTSKSVVDLINAVL